MIKRSKHKKNESLKGFGGARDMFNIRVEDANRAGYVKNRHYKGGTSFPEQFIYRSLLQICPRAENRVIDSDLELEFDIYVPELNLRIEYSGSYWHSDEAKQLKDQKRREYCKLNNATYVEIIETCGNNKLELQREDNHLVYTMSVSDGYNSKINKLIEIIEDMLYRFDIYDAEIDYTRAVYEAFMLSTPYQYNIIRDEDGNIIGKKYSELVYYDYFINNESSGKLLNTGKQLKLKPVVREKDTLIYDDYEMLNQIMFNGNSLDKIGEMSEKQIDLEAKERELEAMRQALDREKANLEEEKRLVDQKREQVDSMYLQMSEKIKSLNREMFIVNKEKDNVEYEKNRFESNIQEEYSRKFVELIAEMEQKITEREREAYDYELDKLKQEVSNNIQYMGELREKIENYKKEICRLKFDRQIKIC